MIFFKNCFTLFIYTLICLFISTYLTINNSYSLLKHIVCDVSSYLHYSCLIVTWISYGVHKVFSNLKFFKTQIIHKSINYFITISVTLNKVQCKFFLKVKRLSLQIKFIYFVEWIKINVWYLINISLNNKNRSRNSSSKMILHMFSVYMLQNH